MGILEDISQLLQKGKSKKVKELVQQAIDEGIDAKVILENGLLAGMNAVGDQFQAGEIFVPEVLVAARAMNVGTELLKPLLQAGDSEVQGKVCIGSIKGDLHDIGKNLVALLLYSNGYTVHDLGNNVAPEDFVLAAQKYNADIVALSALLTTTMENMDHTIEAFADAGLREQIKIIIGGAPVSLEYAQEIGADGYSEDAQGAVELAGKLLEG